MIQLQSQEQESHVQSLGDEIESLARQLEDVKWEREEVRRKHAEEMRALNEGMAGMQVRVEGRPALKRRNDLVADPDRPRLLCSSR